MTICGRVNRDIGITLNTNRMYKRMYLTANPFPSVGWSSGVGIGERDGRDVHSWIKSRQLPSPAPCWGIVSSPSVRFNLAINGFAL